jgi:flagellar hook-basal body complex protein FliE
MPTSVRAALTAAVICAVLSTACGNPPDKEMHQAQGAIAAARAAGAEEYASEELNAAVDALRRAEAAVTDRDYRLALNNALDSRERAQNAAREAADGKARARSRAEGLLAEVTAAVAGATASLSTAEKARLPKNALAGPSEAVRAAQTALQEAGTALAAEDYRKAAGVLNGHAARLREAIVLLEHAKRARPARPTRTGRGRR